MERRLGILAGAGELAAAVCSGARKSGRRCVVAGIVGAAGKGLEAYADEMGWFQVHEVREVIAFFKKNGVEEAVFAGKIPPAVIFENPALDTLLDEELPGDQPRDPTTLIQAAIRLFAAGGIAVGDPLPWLGSVLSPPGLLTRVGPTPAQEEDIAYGWDLARKLADLEIGQTVVVKNKALVALEAMEGTDETIRRGGRLAGEGIVVVKVGRSSQDPRIDLPVVGPDTVQSLVDAGGGVLCFEAGKVPLFRREDALRLADSSRVVVLAGESPLNR